MRLFSACLLAGLAIAGASPAFAAEGTPLEGSWHGGGHVTLTTGNTEKARCRVHYVRKSKTSFSATAVCATPSTRVEQTASLRQTGANTYSGSFFNAEYNVEGSVHVVVHGSSQSVSLSGGGASAQLWDRDIEKE